GGRGGSAAPTPRAPASAPRPPPWQRSPPPPSSRSGSRARRAIRSRRSLQPRACRPTSASAPRRECRRRSRSALTASGDRRAGGAREVSSTGERSDGVGGGQEDRGEQERELAARFQLAEAEHVLAEEAVLLCGLFRKLDLPFDTLTFVAVRILEA